VVNLFVFYTTDPPVLGGLQHLRSLALSLKDLLQCCSIEAAHSVLGNVTHLELLDTDDADHNISACLPLMSRLTHISTDSLLHGPSFQTAPRPCQNIQCLVALAGTHYLSRHLHTLDPLLLEDSRFVCLSQDKDWHEDWLQGLATAENYWVVADAFIAARRNGKVDRKQAELSHPYHGIDRYSSVQAFAMLYLIWIPHGGIKPKFTSSSHNIRPESLSVLS
jgi:hypothetical protein